jgi:hypothetical protein
LGEVREPVLRGIEPDQACPNRRLHVGGYGVAWRKR